MKMLWYGVWGIGYGAILMLLIISCASRPGVQTYFENNRKMVLPDSARVKAVVSVSQGDANEKLSVVLFAVPNKRYRLELSGTFGLSAASILWNQSAWKIVMPLEERYMEGTDDCVFIPFYGGVDIHKFSLLFFGQRVSELDCGEFENNLKLEYRENSAYILSGNDTLKLEIKNIDKKNKWKSDIWNLNVPDKYVRIVLQ
jgi:hypothetical protein